jgi:hypothetical protein
MPSVDDYAMIRFPADLAGLVDDAYAAPADLSQDLVHPHQAPACPPSSASLMRSLTRSWPTTRRPRPSSTWPCWAGGAEPRPGASRLAVARVVGAPAASAGGTARPAGRATALRLRPASPGRAPAGAGRAGPGVVPAQGRAARRAGRRRGVPAGRRRQPAPRQ